MLFKPLPEHPPRCGPFKYYIFIYLITLGILLRTFVATGFMLDTQVNTDSSITVTLCHGPNSINQLPGLDNSNNRKSLPGDNDKETTCNLWASSGISLALQYFNPDYLNSFSDKYLITYKVTFHKSSVSLSKFVRGPPALV